MSKKGKKGKKKIAGLMLFLGWMIFILFLFLLGSGSENV